MTSCIEQINFSTRQRITAVIKPCLSCQPRRESKNLSTQGILGEPTAHKTCTRRLVISGITKSAGGNNGKRFNCR